MNAPSRRISPIRQTAIIWGLLALVQTTPSYAQSADRPAVGPEQKKLESWVGEWNYTGKLHDTFLGPGGSYKGSLTNRFILDGQFLEQRGEDRGIYGGKEIDYKQVTIRWYEPTTKVYQRRSFDNDSVAGTGTMTVNGRAWTGIDTLVDRRGKAYKQKMVITFSADGNSSTAVGELSADDGKTWVPYFEEKETRKAR